VLCPEHESIRKSFLWLDIGGGDTMPTGEMVQDPGWSKLARIAARVPRLLAEVASRPSWLALFVLGRLLPVRRGISRHFGRRGVASAGIPDWRADPAAPAGPPLPTLVATLDRDGICTGLRLAPETVAEIRAFADANPCYGGPDWRTRFDANDQAAAERRYGEALVVGHYPETDRRCPAIGRLVRSPWLRAVAAGYFRAPPTVIDVRLWWSFPSPTASRASLSLAAQDTFHFDLADWKQLKFFFYLTDVDLPGGPHLFVRGSHAKRLLSHQFSLFTGKTDAEITSAYGSAAVQVLIGPAGSGFAEDPFGFHTGRSVRHGRRLMLEVSFGISGRQRRRDFDQAAP
jgi:hypothetical protein